MTVHRTIRRRGKVWCLIDAADLKLHVQRNLWNARQAGFKPPTYEVEPYIGKKGGPTQMVWVIWS